jgi:hypothetical protein
MAARTLNRSAPADPPAADSRRARLTRTELVDRLGEPAGEALFDRIDEQLREGDEVIVPNVREARSSFSAALAPGHARIVQAARRTRGAEEKPDAMVVLALSDLEDLVKAANDFDWAAAFAPRPDLPAATTHLRVRSGARGRRLTL